MSDWIDFEHWKDCVRMEQPGLVFEIQNGQGQSLFTTCTVPLQVPSDWTSAPVHFRLVETPKPRHSNPIPKPRT